MKARWIVLMVMIGVTCLASESFASDQALIKAIEDGNIAKIKANLNSDNINRELPYKFQEEDIKSVPLSIAVYATLFKEGFKLEGFDKLMDVTQTLLANGANSSIAKLKFPNQTVRLYSFFDSAIKAGGAKTKEDKLWIKNFSEYLALLDFYGASKNHYGNTLNQSESLILQKDLASTRKNQLQVVVRYDAENLRIGLEKYYIDNGNYPQTLSKLSYFELSKDVEVIKFWSAGNRYFFKLGHAQDPDVVYSAIFSGDGLSHVEIKEDSRLPTRFSFTVTNIPQGGRIRILDIKPKYHPGIKLTAGKHRLEVRQPAYKPMTYTFIMPPVNDLELRLK